jgi:Saf4/Yju2 protein
MTDRNVMNHYIPADFDPSKLLPLKALRRSYKTGPKELWLRMMLPFTMKCLHCDKFLPIATKFNARSTKVTEELGVDVFRFIGKCKHCIGEFVFRSNPRTADYVLESGGIRCYEENKDRELATAIAKELVDETSDEEKAIYDTEAELKRLTELEILHSKNKELGKSGKIEAVIDKKRKLDDAEWQEEFNQLKKKSTTKLKQISMKFPDLSD